MKIVSVKPTSKFALEVGFEDGTCGVVDLGDLAGQGVFRAWLEEGGFERVKVTKFGALEWPGELDLCPDAVYLRLTGKSPEEIFPALKRQFAHA